MPSKPAGRKQPESGGGAEVKNSLDLKQQFSL